MSLFLYMIIALLSILAVVCLVARCSSKIRRPPAGPSGLQLLWDVLRLYLDVSNLHVGLAKLANKYGPLMFIKVFRQWTIVVSSARVAKEVLKHNDLVFLARPLTISTRKLSYDNRNIFTSHSDYWRDARKIAVSHLFTQKQVSSFRPILQDEVSLMVREISKQADSGQPVNINDAAMALGSNVICRAAFGRRWEESGSWDRSRRFKKIAHNLHAKCFEPFVADFFPSLGWIDKLCGKVARLEKVFKDMDMFLQELIDEHLIISRNRAKSMDGNILDHLIQLRDDDGGRPSSLQQFDWNNVKGVILDILTGGTDSSVATMIWAMTALIKNPAILKKVQKEIRNSIGDKERVDEDDIENLSYLKAIVKETLRFYPPIPLIPRATIMPCLLDGYDIEPKTFVCVNVWAIARDPEYWKEPNKFLPERFLDNSINMKGHDFEFLPFGSGRRMCPGMALGIAEVELALANLLYLFNWEVPDGMVEDDIDTDSFAGLTIHKKNALYLKAKRCH